MTTALEPDAGQEPIEILQPGIGARFHVEPERTTAVHTKMNRTSR